MIIRKLLVFSCALSMALASTAQARPLPESPAEHKEVRVDTKIFDAYMDRYQMGPNFMVNITREGDHLYARATNQERLEIFPEREKEYFAKYFAQAASIRISFKTSDGGKATGWTTR
jgi:D-alanyl-D-alanine-carboxypeptidase/D-alanyl-D-alanine-endopeptidase